LVLAVLGTQTECEALLATSTVELELESELRLATAGNGAVRTVVTGGAEGLITDERVINVDADEFSVGDVALASGVVVAAAAVVVVVVAVDVDVAGAVAVAVDVAVVVVAGGRAVDEDDEADVEDDEDADDERSSIGGRAVVRAAIAGAAVNGEMDPVDAASTRVPAGFKWIVRKPVVAEIVVVVLGTMP